MRVSLRSRIVMLVVVTVTAVLASTRLNADTGTCGGASLTLPFTDVPSSNVFFCSIAEAFFSGLTNGTTSTTYNPGGTVPREQMAAFVSRTMDQSVKRASKRAVLDQFWTTQVAANLALTTVGGFPFGVKSDGADLWVANDGSHSVSRVRASDGKLIGTWTGSTFGNQVLVAMGKIFVAGATVPGSLYQIDPTQPPGAVSTVTSSLGDGSSGIAFDGQRIWIANQGSGQNFTGSVSIVTLNPLQVITVTTGLSSPKGILYDGANIWVTDPADSKLYKLDSSGNILLSVPVNTAPQHPAFDGTNIWVPSILNSVNVVRATGALAGTVLATLTGNGLDGCQQAAFDGERILITNGFGNSVSWWRASDLTPIGTFSTGPDTDPIGVCSDGVNFWITLGTPAKLARF